MGTREEGERGGRKGLNRITRNCGVSRCAWHRKNVLLVILRKLREKEEAIKLTRHVRFRQQGAWVSCLVRS